MPGDAPVLALLTELADVAPSFVVWKNVDAAISGVGDVDAVARPRDWSAIESAHRRWASTTGSGPSFACTHVPGVLVLVAFDPASPERLLQLDISSHIFVHGAPLVPAGALGPVAVADPGGFRRLPAGAEALFKLLAGDPTTSAALSADAEGRDAALALLEAPTAVAARRAVDAASSRALDRLAHAHIVLSCLLAAARRPGLPLRRVLVGRRSIARCPLIRALENGRRVPQERDAWLRAVARTHPAA